MSHTKIRDPNSREAKLISAWKKCCALDKQDAPIPQYYINGFIDGHALLERQNAELVEALHIIMALVQYESCEFAVMQTITEALAAQKVSA